MKKTKEQVGITLVALIITVIVLVVLALVTISSVQDGGIIGYAKNAAEKYRGQFYEYYDWELGYVGEYRDGAVQNETSILDYYSKYLESNGSKISYRNVQNNRNFTTLTIEYLEEKITDGGEYKLNILKEDNSVVSQGNILSYNEEVKRYESWCLLSNVESGDTIIVQILKTDGTYEDPGTVVDERKITFPEYSSIFSCIFNEVDKTATIEGIKNKYIVNSSTENYIKDENGNQITGKLEIPEEITKDNTKYTVVEISMYTSSRSDINEVVIPSTVKRISGYSFEGWSSLNTINMDFDNVVITSDAFVGTPWYESRCVNNCFIVDGKLLGIKYDRSSSSQTIDIPNTVTHIEDLQLQSGGGSPYNITINIPSSVETIASSAASYQWAHFKVTINIDKPRDSISGAPWGAPLYQTTIKWQEDLE